MNLQLRTRYALYAAAELARAGPGEAVTVARAAHTFGIPEAVLAKVFQRLVRHGIAVGTRGAGGGYHLSRPPSAITLLDVVEAFEPLGSPGTCLLSGTAGRCCARPSECVLRRVFDEVEATVRTTFAATSLETPVTAPGGPARSRGREGATP